MSVLCLSSLSLPDGMWTDECDPDPAMVPSNSNPSVDSCQGEEVLKAGRRTQWLAGHQDEGCGQEEEEMPTCLKCCILGNLQDSEVTTEDRSWVNRTRPRDSCLSRLNGDWTRSYLHTSPGCEPSRPRPEANLEAPSPENSRSLRRQRGQSVRHGRLKTGRTGRLFTAEGTSWTNINRGRQTKLDVMKVCSHDSTPQSDSSNVCFSSEWRKSERFTQPLTFGHIKQIRDGLKEAVAKQQKSRLLHIHLRTRSDLQISRDTRL